MRLRSLLFFQLLPLAACSPGTPDKDASADAPGETAATDAIADVGSDSAGDGGCLLEPGGTMCNMIVPGSPIAPMCTSASPPTATGGVVTDGHYVLTSQTFYGWTSSGCPQPEAIDWLICGSQWEFASLQTIGGDSGGGGTGYGNYDVTEGATTLTFDETCVGSSTFAKSYTATGATLTIYTPQTTSIIEVDTFTRM